MSTGLAQDLGERAPRLLSRTEMQTAAMKNLGLLDIQERTAGEVGESLGSLTPLSVRGEALRAALWALSAEASEPVYVTRLLHAARPLAGAMPFETVEDERDGDPALRLLGGALAELHAIGDVASLPRGRWLPAPLRCVPLVAVRRWLLLGGWPTSRLPTALRQSMEHNGVARLLVEAPAELGFPLPVQDQDDWARAPRESLADWTRGVIQGATLRHFDDPQVTFDCYAPSVALNSLQYYRWVTDSKTLPDGRYLARQRAKRGPTSYSLVEVRSGKVVATGSLDLREGDVRRLIYGLDFLAGHPVRVRVTRTRTAWIFELRNELPSAEHRLFTALGRLHLSPDGSYYPRRWEVAARYAVQAARALLRLEVRLDGAEELISAAEETDPD